MLSAALTGVKVVDLSRILAGPWCTQNLADLGADVIKIERAGSGDDTRGWGPPYLEPVDGETLSAYFTCCNRGKKSVALDFTQEADRQSLLALIRDADVLVENFRVGTLKKYGLDYDRVKAVNPQLIYASITGYGQTGPKAHRPGYDYIFQGLGGLMSYTGRADGEPGAGPLRTGVAVVDIATGMYATSAVLAALFQRTQTGKGAWLDLALLDVAVALNANQAANFLVSGSSPQRSGNAHPNLAPYEVFRASDGFFILAIGNDTQFARFCDFCGRPELAQDARFKTNSGRIDNLASLRTLLGEILAAQPRQYWTEALDKLGISWGSVNSLEEVFQDEQVLHRRMLQKTTHPKLGEIRLVKNPMLAGNQEDGTSPAAPPMLGEHTESVLGCLKTNIER
ncbi:CaiB/BaiF CoA-transferase family protein [Pusillimonas sp. SM2304]|uniref:CaiB/BaiF CoA transferase family protein n=1 Tax=Pusillimonas sp. SM2304 TaxID=3073241 RepID=UPI00287471B9|nr:CaiB/BaiF CoA-transferase family protein [Pusillimonas sp. SM2304]MDS1139181.1 CaiB/BaiF CoA-transferase family protein [Pusillimonas sp. SM2304]